jgi:hypothetical protein
MEGTQEQPATPAAEAMKQLALTRTKIDKWGRSQYRLKNSNATTVRFGASFFNGKPPDSVTIGAVNIATHVGEKKKLTAEERKALPKPTGAEKLAIAKDRAERAKARAERLEAALKAEQEREAKGDEVPAPPPAEGSPSQEAAAM